MVNSYIPNAGDIVWLSFDPQQGHEQSGRRPALILSPKIYNEKTGLALCVPITQQIKNYPFEIILPKNSSLQGCVLADHIKNLDWKARNATFIETTSPEFLTKIKEKLLLLI